MKVSPMIGGVQTSNSSDGRSASPDRMARAKAAAAGEPAPTADQSAASPESQTALKRIRMRTNQSTNRHEMLPTPEAQASDPVVDAAPVTPSEDDAKGHVLSDAEHTEAATEETKPLSPQFAALARQKRALQLKEQEILAKEKALESKSTGSQSVEELLGRIKTNALSVLLEQGVTYDQLTEQILAQNSGSPDVAQFESKLKALEDRLENQSKSRAEQDEQTEKRVLAQIGRNVEQLIAQGGEDYEMIREAGYAPKVLDLIHRTYKKTGEVMDEADAATLIENELLEESLKYARIKKVQSKLGAAPAPEKTQPVQTDRGNTRTMRTLTNRDGSSSVQSSKRERAIAAMEGRLK